MIIFSCLKLTILESSISYILETLRCFLIHRQLLLLLLKQLHGLSIVLLLIACLTLLKSSNLTEMLAFFLYFLLS